MTRGFTLIETIIYIALMALFLGGAVTAAYELLDGSGSVANQNTAQEEGNFVLAKLSWALSGVQTVSAPAGWGSALSLTKYDGTTVDVRLQGGAIEMREDGGAYAPLTTENVSVSSLSFHYLPAAAGAPPGLEASTTIRGQEFYLKRHIRK